MIKSPTYSFLNRAFDSDFESMQGQEEGEPSWLWSNTITMKATVSAKYVGDYDAISKLLGQQWF